MRIWFQKHTVVGRSPWLDDCYIRHARAAVSESTQVEFFGLPARDLPGAAPDYYVRFGQLEVFFSWYFAERALRGGAQRTCRLRDRHEPGSRACCGTIAGGHPGRWLW